MSSAQTPTERVVAALIEQGCDPRQRGEQWQSRCPAHDDHVPSLGVREGSKGQALLKCQAGCETAAVVAALGLRVSDLFPERADRFGLSSSPSRSAFARSRSNVACWYRCSSLAIANCLLSRGSAGTRS